MNVALIMKPLYCAVINVNVLFVIGEYKSIVFYIHEKAIVKSRVQLPLERVIPDFLLKYLSSNEPCSYNSRN